MVASLLLLLLAQLPATPGEAPAGCLCEEEVVTEAALEAAKLVDKVAAHLREERDVSRRGELDVARKGDDEKAHCGYQKWHRDVDAEVVEWLKRNREATAEQFEAMLRLIYNRPDMRARFPHGF